MNFFGYLELNKLNGNALTRKFKADILHSRLLLQKDAMRWVVSPHIARALNTFCGNFDISQVSAAIFKSKRFFFCVGFPSRIVDWVQNSSKHNIKCCMTDQRVTTG